MARHEVDKETLEKWMQQHAVEFAACHGGGSNKTFLVSMSGRMCVTDHKEVVYEGSDRSAAVDAYNSRY